MAKLNVFFIFLILFSCKSKIEKKLNPYYDFPNEEQIDSYLKIESEKRGIDFLFSKAILIKESHYKKNNISTTGAVGLMQLMPRNGSFITSNFKNYELAGKEKNKIYFGKSRSEWISEYRKELIEMFQYYQTNEEELYKKDKRFNPEWNIKSGVVQLSDEYKFFISRKHSEYKSRFLASAAYNAGRFAVMKEKSNPKFDSIPINSQTEFYVVSVEKVYQVLKKNNGRLPKDSLYLLY